MGVGSLKRTWISYPDDPTNPYAELRAWDRFLVSIGLLPVHTFDLTKVGPILVNPTGDQSYCDFYILESGHLGKLIKVLSPSRVRKALGP